MLLVAALALVMATPAGAHAQGPLYPGTLRIEYIAHASFRITGPRGTRVVLDPYADRVWLGYRFPEGLGADAWVISHPHYDHDGGEFLGRPVPWDEDARVLRYPGRYRVGEIGLVGVPGRHAGRYGREFGQRNTIWVVEVGGLRVAHWGDNGPVTDALKAALGPIDVLMLPLDDQDHILAPEDVDGILAALEPTFLIPMHYRIDVLEPGDGPEGLGGRKFVTGGGVFGLRFANRNVLDLPAGEPLGDRKLVTFTTSPLIPLR